ncbi:MAG: thiamine pyrophosphate-binding protein, partial [Bacteroidetes bacterium]
QALWTAAHHRLEVVFLILANRRYRILERNLDRYRARAGLDARTGYPHLALDDPAVDFVALAGGFGVPGRRVATAAELGAALAEAFAAGGPRLVEAQMA